MHEGAHVKPAARRAVFDTLQMQAATLDVMTGSHTPSSMLLARQQQRLTRLLEVARSGSKFYRDRLGSGAIRASDWLRLPAVTRSELMENFQDWVTDPELQLDELREFISDHERLADPWLNKYMVWESSGTSGSPGIFVQDARVMAIYDALETMRHRAPSRAEGPFGTLTSIAYMGLTDRYALLTATGGHFASVSGLERLRQLNPWLQAHSRTFSILQPTAELVEELNEYQPTVLATYPSAAALLAEEAEQGRLRIEPRCLLTGGEALSAATRARLVKVFDVEVRSNYGASEFLPIAWECSHGHLHVNEDWILLEPVDEHQRPVRPGELSHSVLLTNLANYVQPLIRYDLGDRVRLSTERCACGSSLSVIDVQGRRDDTFQVPGRQQGQPVSLLPLAVCTVLEEECGVFDFQVRQSEPGTLVVRLPQTGAQANEVIERCRTALQAFALMQGAEPIKVIGEPGCSVPRGRSGKACRVMFRA